VNKLPKANFTLLRALSAFLISIINNSEVNKMSIRNVGIVFSPTLNIPPPVFSMFLTEFDAIFGETQEDTPMPSLERQSEALNPEDIRSPRRQMFSDIPTPSYTQDTFSTNVRQFSTNAQQQPTYEQVLHDSHTDDNDTGFIPMNPAYDTGFQQAGSVTVPGPEYAVARPRNLPAGGPAKQRRRESSMLLMGSAQRKSSLPMMRGDTGMPTFNL
jgi:RalA-binding protein 1